MIHATHRIRTRAAEEALQQLSYEQYRQRLSNERARGYVAHAMNAAKRIVRSLRFQGDRSFDPVLIKGLAGQHQVHHLLWDFTANRVKELLA